MRSFMRACSQEVEPIDRAWSHTLNYMPECSYNWSFTLLLFIIRAPWHVQGFNRIVMEQPKMGILKYCKFIVQTYSTHTTSHCVKGIVYPRMFWSPSTTNKKIACKISSTDECMPYRFGRTWQHFQFGVNYPFKTVYLFLLSHKDPGPKRLKTLTKKKQKGV